MGPTDRQPESERVWKLEAGSWKLDRLDPMRRLQRLNEGGRLAGAYEGPLGGLPGLPRLAKKACNPRKAWRVEKKLEVGSGGGGSQFSIQICQSQFHLFVATEAEVGGIESNFFVPI